MNKTINDHIENSYLQILDAIADMVLVKGPKSKLLWANKAFCAHYGMSNAELQGLIDAPFSEPDYTQKFIKDDSYVFENGITLDIPEEPVNRHDGVVRLFHTVKSPIFDSNNKVIMTVGISRDITDRIETEKKLKIEQERSICSAKMAALGEMAAGIAHEINTPLATIKLLAELCNDFLNKKNIDVLEIEKHSQKIINATDKIAKIVSGLKTFSREGTNDTRVITKITDIIDDTLAFSKERILSHEIKLIVNNPDAEATLRCSPSEISQVLLNLLNNAHDAIVNSKSEKWIKIESKVESNQVELSVTDSGSGIATSDCAKLFTPFYTTKEIGKGTGLGLSISRKIIENHGGTIFIDSKSPNTKFVIIFKH